MMTFILHIATPQAWQQAQTNGSYQPEMFSREGFIHCSTPTQVVEVANRHFRGQTGLLLLKIEAERVRAEIRYENLEGGKQLFPHIYGELNLDAVVAVSDFEPQAGGTFSQL
jgi:uncharacterized protein (DUF952 family)